MKSPLQQTPPWAHRNLRRRNIYMKKNVNVQSYALKLLYNEPDNPPTENTYVADSNSLGMLSRGLSCKTTAKPALVTIIERRR